MGLPSHEQLCTRPQGEGAARLLFCALTFKIPRFRVPEFNAVFCFGGLRGGCYGLNVSPKIYTSKP